MCRKKITTRTAQMALLCTLLIAAVGWAVAHGTALAVVEEKGPATVLDCIAEKPLSDCPDGKIVPNKSLMITDLCVVEDKCRTRWDSCGGCSPGSCGAWTFGSLMAAIAGHPNIFYDPHGLSDFVEEWMDQFAQNTEVENGFVVRSRELMHERVMGPWWELMEEMGLDYLDMRYAPFRLLAIVNRVDLRGEEPGPYGGSTAGEGRFIFSFLQIDPSVPDPDQWNHLFIGGGRGTIILEYHLPAETCEDVVTWGKRWRALSDIPFGEEFNKSLQEITDDFAGFGAGGSKAPNYSALAQLRTNEVLNGFGQQNPWELREFQLVGSGVGVPLTQTTVAQTVDIQFNEPPPGGLLEKYLVHDQLAIINHQHEIPLFFDGQPFRAGSSLNPSAGQPGGGSNFLWVVEPFKCTETRHNFAILNCNGCHAAEAGLFQCGPQGGPPHANNFTHVSGRLMGEKALLSRFLIGDFNGVEDLSCPPSPAPNTHDCFLPATTVNHGAMVRYMHDLHRRSLDLCHLVGSSCVTITKTEVAVDPEDHAKIVVTETEVLDAFDSDHMAKNRVH